MRLLICFDISNDKTRRLLVSILETYGVRCQHSVFEFDIPLPIYKIINQEISNVKLEEQDKVFIYPIPEEDNGKILRIGCYTRQDKVHVF